MKFPPLSSMSWKKVPDCLMSFIIITLITIILLSCKENKVVPKTNNFSEELGVAPDVVSNDIEVIFVDSSYTKAILKAKRARIFNERMETLLDSGLRVDFFNKQSGAKVSTLTADSAKIDDKTKNMIAKSNVVVISDSSHTRLETKILQWDNTTQKLYSTEFVKITSPKETIRGYGFESDVYLNHYKIFRVSGEQK
jgi:LPS export ABC transporter protein LptC